MQRRDTMQHIQQIRPHRSRLKARSAVNVVGCCQSRTHTPLANLPLKLITRHRTRHRVVFLHTSTTTHVYEGQRLLRLTFSFMPYISFPLVYSVGGGEGKVGAVLFRTKQTMHKSSLVFYKYLHGASSFVETGFWTGF